MDPLSTFSLVCGIIQIIDFSSKAVKKCREIVKDGALAENTEIEELAKHLLNLPGELHLTDHGDMDDIVKLGTDCSNTARELVAELEALKVDEPPRKREILWKTIMTYKKREPIHNIEKRLWEYRKLLDHKILVDLRKRSDLLALQQTEGFQDLDSKVQIIISKLAQSEQNFEGLRKYIQAENASIKGHITQELQQHRKDLAHQQYHQKFLESLWYPEIYRRQETVGIAHQKTFQWIFEPDGPDMSTRRWDNFVQWLEQGDGLYWISGKAGSGKSTLMSYIYQNEQTSRLLRTWSGAKEIFVPCFFFWNAGATLQKSSEGLLRSVLYQLLQKYPILTPSSFGDQSFVEAAQDGHNFQPIAAWTEHRLRTTFRFVMLQAQEYCRICFLIDGLDETSDEPDAVIGVVKDLLSADAKVCLSSRRDRPYIDAFDSSSKLRLQDLTEPDIRKYVWDKLHTCLLKESANEHSRLLDSIVSKAQGVFLWVRLVVGTLIRGLQMDDSLEQLQVRVDSTPSEIEALYAKMFSKIEVFHRAEAVLLFQLALMNRNQSLLDAALVVCNAFDHMSEMSLQKALGFSRRTQNRIPAVCAGLLEIHLEDKDSLAGIEMPNSERLNFRDDYLTLPFRDAPSSEMRDISYYERHAYMAFIHRTARDWLQSHLEEKNNEPPSPHSNYVRALLVKLTLLGLPKKPGSRNKESAIAGELAGFHRDYDFGDKIACNLLKTIMFHTACEEFHTATAQVSLCDDIDRTFVTEYRRRCVVIAPSSHWCARWNIFLRPADHYQPARCSWTSSRLSSSSSFRVTESKPLVGLRGPVDLLGLAACWGLSRYVMETLNLQQSFDDGDYMDYLLCCCLLPLYGRRNSTFGSAWFLHILELMDELVARGGNPNFYVEGLSNTVWGFLLTEGPWSVPTTFAKVSKTFLEKGADIHVNAADLLSISNNGGSGPEAFLRHERSPLCIVRGLLGFGLGPDFKALEQTIFAKGGREFHRFTHIALERDIESDDYCLNEISQEQHDRIMTALSAAGHGSASKPDIYWKWQPLLKKIYKDIWRIKRDSTGRVLPDEDTNSHTDSEEEFHDAVEGLTMADG